MCLLLTAVSRTVTQLYTYDVFWTGEEFWNFDMSCGNLDPSNPSTNYQLTEKKHSKRKAPYRPLKEQKHLKEKQGGRLKHNL